MENKEKQINVLWILVILMLLNIAISGYIEIQKAALLNGDSTDVCFETGAGGCGDVQLSEYGRILGISVGMWGIICFSFMSILVSSIAYSLQSGKLIDNKKDIEKAIKFTGLCFVIGTIGAAYFIFLQFFVIGAICKYCMVIDGITIFSTIYFFVTFKKEVDFYQI